MKHLVAATVLSLAGSMACAQSWPVKPVKFYVAGAAGSAPDIIVRVVGDSLSKIWGQQLVVDNRVGAAGNIGTAAAAKAPGDGYNFLVGQAAPLALNLHTFKSLEFDAEKDFVPVVSLGISPMMIAVNNELPARNIRELIALAKAQPGKINFGTSSQRNIPHLTGELLNNMAGIQLAHVPYNTNAQAAAEAISGLTQIYIDGVPPIVGHMKSGRLRVIAVSSLKRLPNFPDIASVSETVPGFEFNGWFAIVAPAGTPVEVVRKVNADTNAVLRQPELAARMLGFGIYEPGGTPEQLAAFLRAERENYGRAVKAARLEKE